MKINRIVFFCVTPFTERDFKRFGGEILKENGFEVWFYDFSAIVYPKLYKNCTFPDLHKPQNHFLFSNEGEALKAISEIPADSLIMVLLWFGPDTFKIFRALSKTNILYCALATNSIPTGNDQESPGIFHFIKKIFPLNLSKCKKIFFRPKFARLWGIRRPEFCLVASKLSLERYRTRYLIGENTEILWAHPLDYDVFLENSKDKEDVKTTSNRATFLDPVSPLFQADALSLGYKVYTTVENYYPSLCKFFDYVEKQLEIKVEIASHPKASHPQFPEYYGGRQTIRGETFGMLKNSRFVMANLSNAVQFAILLKKPVFFLTTNELENDPRLSVLIKAFAHSLGKTVINVDQPFNFDLEKELYVDEKIYDDYIDRYIKKRGSEELNTWQILANRIKRLDECKE